MPGLQNKNKNTVKVHKFVHVFFGVYIEKKKIVSSYKSDQLITA